MLNKDQLAILWIMGIIISLISIRCGIIEPNDIKLASQVGFHPDPSWLIFKHYGYFISPFRVIVIPVIVVSMLSIITLSSIRK